MGADGAQQGQRPRKGNTSVRKPALANRLLRCMGCIAIVLSGDPAVFDRWLWLRRHLRRGPVRTLDAGCGSGAFTIYAAKVGNEAVGLSFDESQVRKARHRSEILGIRNVRFVVGDLRELDQLGPQLGHFDQVICFETIEHIRDDKKLIQDLAGLLKPGGRLLLTTPFEGRRPWWRESTSEHEDGGHVTWGYRHETVRELFEENGVRMVVAEYVCGCISRLLVNLGRMLSRPHYRFGWAVAFPLRLLQLIDRPLTRMLGHPFSCIAVVGVRDGDAVMQPQAAAGEVREAGA